MNVKQIQTDIILPRMAELQISKYKLAKLTGLAESTITRWFNGERGLSLESFFKVTKALDLILIYEHNNFPIQKAKRAITLHKAH